MDVSSLPTDLQPKSVVGHLALSLQSPMKLMFEMLKTGYFYSAYSCELISKALRMARVNEESHALSCHPHVCPRIESTILPILPSRSALPFFGRYSFPFPQRVGGRVGLGGWLHTKTIVVWIRRFSNGRRHWWRHSCDVTDDVTVVTSLMTSLLWLHCRRHHRIPNIVTSLLTSLLWRHYRRHGWRHYCDITIVQHASHAHPHVNITVEFSDIWLNFVSTQFRRNGNISIFSDILPNP